MNGRNGGNAKEIGARLNMIGSMTGKSRPDFKAVALLSTVHRFFSPRIVSDGARHFGTKESALAFHAEVVERIISGEFEG